MSKGIKEYKRGMVLQVSNKVFNPYKVVAACSNGHAACLDCTNDPITLGKQDIAHCTLLPESIYEGQEWYRESNENYEYIIRALSDDFEYIGYSTLTAGMTWCKPKKEFLHYFTPVPDKPDKPDVPEKMIIVRGTAWSESTVVEALLNHTNQMKG